MSTPEIIALIISALAVCVTGLLKYTVDRRDREIDTKLLEARSADEKQKTADDEQKKQLTAEVKELTTKNHKIELEHAKLEGEVKVLIKTIEPIETDLKDIKDEMVPRQEWREAQHRVEQAYERLEGKLDKMVNYSQWRGTPASIPAQRSIPREETALDEYKSNPPHDRPKR